MLISSQSGTNRVQNVIQQSFFCCCERVKVSKASIIQHRLVRLNCNKSRNFLYLIFFYFCHCRAAFAWLYETEPIYVKAKSSRSPRITDWTLGRDPNWKTSFRRAPSCLASAKSTQDTITQVLFWEHQLYSYLNSARKQNQSLRHRTTVAAWLPWSWKHLWLNLPPLQKMPFRGDAS